MRFLVTGAGGFVGQALVQRLLEQDGTQHVTAMDQRFGGPAQDARVLQLEGDFAAAALLDEALKTPPDVVFHLASLPGSLAEREAGLGWQVNLLAPQALLQRLAALGTVPRVVFASSVAVYGALPAQGRIDESWPTAPALSYGAHKLMTEILLADLSRRGELDGVSLRLPGIVARPLSPSGHGSAFMSDAIRLLGNGHPYDCPVSAQAQAWWMSLPCCVDNLVHAAHLPTTALPPSRTVQLPVLTATMRELVAAIQQASGRTAQPNYRPDERIEALFGRQPMLDTPQARALGFRDDGSLVELVRRSGALA